MNEQLQQALAGLISSTLDAKEFLIAEIPDAVIQLLLWKFSVSILTTLVGISCLVLSYFIMKWTKANWEEVYNSDREFVIGVACVILVTLGMILSFQLSWLQILVAPKIFLIEYASSLVLK